LGRRGKEADLMHARVAAFENRDTSRVDELVQLVRDRQSTAGEIPDALGMYMLVDRAAGTAIGISIFESEEAIDAAEPLFERMGDDIPAELRGRRISVDRYEVAIHEVSDGATAARVSTFSGDPASFDQDIRHAVEEVLPEIRTIDGWKGVVVLVDRDAGTQKTVTLWESVDALTASERQADALRARAAEQAHGRIVSVERYEVPLAFDRAPTLVR
jgi:heme-degrading monooxygenase HmoA